MLVVDVPVVVKVIVARTGHAPLEFTKTLSSPTNDFIVFNNHGGFSPVPCRSGLVGYMGSFAFP